MNEEAFLMWDSCCFANRFPSAGRSRTADGCAAMEAYSALFLFFFFQCNANLEHTEILFLTLNYHRNGCGGDLAIFLAQFTRNPSDVKLFL